MYVAFICVSDVVLRVGFESMKYTVAEREGTVGVCLVSSVPVPNTLSFMVYTEERSAQGKCIYFVTDLLRCKVVYSSHV